MACKKPNRELGNLVKYVFINNPEKLEFCNQKRDIVCVVAILVKRLIELFGKVPRMDEGDRWNDSLS